MNRKGMKIEGIRIDYSLQREQKKGDGQTGS